MPRQGRQPKQLTGASKRTAKPATAEASSSMSTKSTKGKGRATPSAASGSAEEGALDVYDYSARIKRPRGDVDPLARASFGSRKGKGKQQAKSTAAKGKGPAAPSDEEDNTEDEGGSDEDEDESGGFRVRGNEVVEFTGVKPAGFKLGMDSDAEDGAGFLGSDDEDEEIDSDMAEDEDEEEDLPRRKGGSSAGKGKARDMDVDLDEDEIDYDDEEGAGWMDLTEVLDAGGFHGSDDEDEGSDGSAASDDEERNEEDEEMSDDDDPSALDKLDSFVSGLDSKKRKSRDGEDEDGEKKKKRVVLQERTEAYPEGEFVAVGTSGGADGAHPPFCYFPHHTHNLPIYRESQPRRSALFLFRLEEPPSCLPPQIAQTPRLVFRLLLLEGHNDQLASQSRRSSLCASSRSAAG